MPLRGEVWLAELDPVRGHEQSGTRPCVVISTDYFNQGPAGLIVALPLTTRDRAQPLHVPVSPPEGGVRARSFIKCEDIRSLSLDRLIQKWGTVQPETLAAIALRLRRLLEL